MGSDRKLSEVRVPSGQLREETGLRGATETSFDQIAQGQPGLSPVRQAVHRLASQSSSSTRKTEGPRQGRLAYDNFVFTNAIFMKMYTHLSFYVQVIKYRP